MADGFIVRRGGKVEEVLRTATPDINFVSKTQTEIVVTFKNNDAGEADVFYGLTSPLTTKVTLATNTTSSNITFSGLDGDTQYTISAYAIVTDATLKKIKSEIVSTQITTDAAVFTAATGGTTEDYNLDGKRYRSHTFTSDSNFVVTTVGDADGDRNKVDYLIIAGGGGAGASFAGGGGAGGYRTTLGTSGADTAARTKVTVTAQTYGIVIGAGGNGRTFPGNFTTDVSGFSGTASTALGVSTVGGGGGSGRSNTTSLAKSGGSGGGGSNDGSNTPAGSGTADEGRAGGTGFDSGANSTGGGGGGAFAVGANGASLVGGNGGNGLANILRTGSSETRAGGGAGGTSDSGTAGTGGTGGGGNGSNSSTAGSNATVNTGSGGGGGGWTQSTNTGGSGGNGADGIVVIRYEIAPSV
jgi:hypothetical protein